MSYTVTAKTQTATVVYTSIGERNAVMDAAYNLPGVLGVSLMVQS